MENNINNSKSSWVSKNPKKIGLIITAAILLLSLLIIDRLIYYFQPSEEHAEPNIVRAIRLREHHPGSNIIIYPDEFILKSMEPILNAGITYETFKKEYDRFNEIVREVVQTNEIPLIDLAKLVPQEKEYLYDPFHYNDNGSKVVANIISKELIDIIKP